MAEGQRDDGAASLRQIAHGGSSTVELEPACRATRHAQSGARVAFGSTCCAPVTVGGVYVPVCAYEAGTGRYQAGMRAVSQYEAGF